MHIKETHIKSKVYIYYFDYLLKAKNSNKNILMRKPMKICSFISLDMIVENQ